MYSIAIDPEAGMVEVELSGMMSADEVASSIAELKRLFVLNHLHSSAMVIDVSNCPIQSQEMIGTMSRHMATMPKARALAIVTGSSLARMQVRRLFHQSYARIAATMEEGRAWVVAGVEPAA